jgi:hypothetical protein
MFLKYIFSVIFSEQIAFLFLRLGFTTQLRRENTFYLLVSVLTVYVDSESRQFGTDVFIDVCRTDWMPHLSLVSSNGPRAPA